MSVFLRLLKEASEETKLVTRYRWSSRGKSCTSGPNGVIHSSDVIIRWESARRRSTLPVLTTDQILNNNVITKDDP